MLLKILSVYVPTFIKRQKMQELFLITADAFQAELPNLSGLSYQEILLRYAVFTKEHAEKALQCACDLVPIKNRLYENALQMGRSIKESLNISTPEEVMLLIRIIYNILAIDLYGDLHGNIVIKQCFFSKFYSSEICQIISSLDEGLAAGLSNGQLQFTQRITEGNNCCKARLEMEKIKA